MALLAVASLCLIPSTGVDGATFTNIDGDDVMEANSDGEYTILYSNPDMSSEEEEVAITYEAKLVDSKGNTKSSAVSPSSGDLTNNMAETLTVDSPKETGRYTLEVTFTYEVGDEVRETITEKYTIHVVNPIKLSLTVESLSDSMVEPSALGVFFWIDGVKMDDSYTTFTTNTDGTATVTYEWIANPSNGAHTFKVLPADGSEIAGLGVEQTFYVGEQSYTLWTALAILFVILMIVALVWVYRKPVKNYGKPKSRR